MNKAPASSPQHLSHAQLASPVTASTALVVMPQQDLVLVPHAVEPQHNIKPQRDWTDDLSDSGGYPRPNLANVSVALRNAPEWQQVLAFDSFSHRIVARRRTPWGVVERWTDQEDRLATVWMQGEDRKIYVGTNIVSEAIQTVARENSFHPVREYLDGLKWDGVDRIDEWLSTYAAVPSSEYSKAVGSKWLIGAVARIYEPGCKNDCALIFEGEQGLKKSTLLRVLGGEWFSDDLADFGSKDAAMQIQGVRIVEIAELDAMSGGNIARIKAFMSRQVERYRPPYGKYVIDVPRQCVFAGTVNHSTYLKDETGARRFWPVTCGAINIDELKQDRDQLWAEARDRYQAGEKWWLDSNLAALATQEQQQRFESDAWAEAIDAWVLHKETVSISEVLQSCIDKPTKLWTQPDKNRVSKCLQSLGWKRYKQRLDDGRSEWRYRRGPDSTPFRPLNQGELKKQFMQNMMVE